MTTVRSFLQWKQARQYRFISYVNGQADAEEIPLPRLDSVECRWCSAPLYVSKYEVRDAEYDYFGDVARVCPLCGWRVDYDYRYEANGCVDPDGFYEESTKVAILRDETATAHEASYITQLSRFAASHPSWIEGLSSRAFEKLVATCLDGTGFETRLTQQSRDGGVDVYCMDPLTGEVMVVECKHHASGKTVGVYVVRALVGAMVDWEAKRGRIVTSSTFTRPATEYAARVSAVGFEMQLVNLTSFLVELDLLQASIVGDIQTAMQRRDLIQFNSELLIDMGFMRA